MFLLEQIYQKKKRRTKKNQLHFHYICGCMDLKNLKETFFFNTLLTNRVCSYSGEYVKIS